LLTNKRAEVRAFEPKPEKETAMAIEGDKVFKLVGAIFTLVGVILLSVGGWTGNQQYTILNSWPTVEAEVTQSHVTTGRDSEGTTMYGTQLEFRYTVNAKEFTTPASSSYRSSSYTQMKHKADQYTPGTRHTIRYNPTNPDDIHFDVGYNFGFFFLPVLLGGMGVVFAGLGITFLYVSRRQRVFECPACGCRMERSQDICPSCHAPRPIG
jgi:hypothetical protein